jgi:hypothetical protein
MIKKIPIMTKVYKFAKSYFLPKIFWMIDNFFSNIFNNMIHININSKYQIAFKFVMVKYGLPKSTILLILLFL